jgi:hypothetical protein
VFSKGKLKKGGKEVCSEMDDAIFFFCVFGSFSSCMYESVILSINVVTI